MPSNPSHLPPAPAAPDTAIAVSEFRLENGMQVVVIPDRRSPIVTHMVWYRNGSTDDPPGKSGLAHFLEHLMFKGTERYPAGAFSETLAALGAEENAFTGWDFTAYHQRIPNEYLATCMAYEADRMRNLVLDEAVVTTERGVVLEERSMVADANPAGLLGEAVAIAAGPAHPSGRPIIGWRHEIAGLTRADALAYYRRFYTPENAILVVAGDAEPEAVRDLAAEIYGAIPPTSAPPERQHLQDPPSRAHRQITLAETTVGDPQLTRLHRVPSPVDAAPGQAEALEVLAFLLGGGNTSIFHIRRVCGTACETSHAVAELFCADGFAASEWFGLGCSKGRNAAADGRAKAPALVRGQTRDGELDGVSARLDVTRWLDRPARAGRRVACRRSSMTERARWRSRESGPGTACRSPEVRAARGAFALLTCGALAISTAVGFRSCVRLWVRDWGRLAREALAHPTYDGLSRICWMVPQMRGLLADPISG